MREFHRCSIGEFPVHDSYDLKLFVDQDIRGPKIVTPDFEWSLICGRVRQSTLPGQFPEQAPGSIPSSTVISGINSVVPLVREMLEVAICQCIEIG